MTAKERIEAAKAAAQGNASAITANLGEIELQEGYEFDGKQVPDKFVLETADSLFSVSCERCHDEPEEMLALLTAGAFAPSVNKETGEQFTTAEGKLVYSVPFKKDRTATGVKPTAANVTVSPIGATDDKYSDIVITVVRKAYK